MNKATMCNKGTEYTRSQAFFSYALVKSEPTWLRLDELRSEAKKYFYRKNINSTTKRCRQMEMVAQFLYF